MDTAAQVPSGTAKNYFPTRDALLRAVAERCMEQYRRLTEGPPPADREALVAMLVALLRNVAGPGRSRLIAFQKLLVEGARTPWLSDILDPLAESDFAGFELAQRAAGLPVTPHRAATVTLAFHAAIPYLLAGSSRRLATSGLDDPERFVRNLLATVYSEP